MNVDNKTLNVVETGFNIAGSIPVVSVFSGLIRATIGKIQLIAAMIFTGICLLAEHTSKEPKKWNALSTYGIEHMTHGSLNILRGMTESFLGSTIVGSIIPFAIQISREEKFDPMFKYGALTDQRPKKSAFRAA